MSIFGFIKRLFGKKEEPAFPPESAEFPGAESAESFPSGHSGELEEKSLLFESTKSAPGGSPFEQFRPTTFPETRPTPPGPTSADLQLMLTKLDLISQRLEMIDRRLQYIEQVAKESK